jgi:hypothetical protein
VKLLAEEPLRTSLWDISPDFAGRRLRAFARMVRLQTYTSEREGFVLIWGDERIPGLAEHPTYGSALKLASHHPPWQANLAALRLRDDAGGMARDRPERVTDASQLQQHGRDWELPPCLQDLAGEICEDVRAACAAFSDPGVWYPGVDVGIPPVPDDHVHLVIAAMQRELSRETRPGPPHANAYSYMSTNNLPAAPLAELPFRVQRALVERRRLRFAEYGIGQAEWEAGTWSLWNVRDDPDWTPRKPGAPL